MFEDLWKFILIFIGWTYTMDNDTPASDDDPKQGDDRIRELKDALREREDIDHYWPFMTSEDVAEGSEVASPATGHHRALHLREQDDLGEGVEGVPLFGAQTQSNNGTDKPELTFTDEDDDSVQMTKDGARYDDPGVTKMFAGPAINVPAGWLICDGRAYSRTVYLDLFTALGTLWGSGDGSTTFNLPDMRGRSPMGVNDSALPNGKNGLRPTRNEGDEEGDEEDTLTSSKIPEHSHNVDDPEHHHEVYYKDFEKGDKTKVGSVSEGGASPTGTRSTADKATGISVNDDGEDRGDAHNNLHPIAVINFIIKT